MNDIIGYSQTQGRFGSWCPPFLGLSSALRRDGEILEINNIALKFKIVILILLDWRWDVIYLKLPWKMNGKQILGTCLLGISSQTNHFEIITKREIRETLSSEGSLYLKKNVPDIVPSGQLVNLLHEISGGWHTFFFRGSPVLNGNCQYDGCRTVVSEIHTIYKRERESNSGKDFNIPLVFPRLSCNTPHKNYTKVNKIAGSGKYPPQLTWGSSWKF